MTLLIGDIMSLGIFGDSFADDNENILQGVKRTSWLVELSRKLDLKLENHGYPGTSLWYSYKKFLENYKDKTNIVFVYTEHNRWPSLDGTLKRFGSIYSQEMLDRFPDISKDEYDILQQMVNVHKYIFEEEFNIFVFQQIFNNVNAICKENNIKLVNVFPFVDDDFPIDVSNSYGSCLTGLTTISQNELKDVKYVMTYGIMKFKHPKLKFLSDNVDYRANHLSSVNNTILADIILNQFDKNEVLNLYHDDRFVYDIQILLDYIDEIEAANV